MSLVIRGLDLSKVEAARMERARSREGRVLILDGDGPAYRVAATVKRLDTAVRHFQSAVLTQMAMANCGFCTVHLTHRTCTKNGRMLVRAAKPYQGQRKGKMKPPLLEPLREAMLDNSNWLPEFEVRMHYGIEADDGMIIQAHQLKDGGVIWSDDKDLRCTPFYYYNQETGQVDGFEPHGYVKEKILPSGVRKVIGRGPIFFWAQMLMGDSADNVAGLTRYYGRKIGASGAYEVLKAVRSADLAANIVIAAYEKNCQNVIAEGHLLHLMQHPRQTVEDYMLSFDLTEENAEFVQQCAAEPWMEIPDA